MTAMPSLPRPPVAEPPAAAGPRPATVIAVLVLVLLLAALLVGGTVASGLALAAFVLSHPGFGWSPSVILPSAFGTVLNLVLAAGDVLLGLRLWQGARRARMVLSAWLGLSALIVLVGIVATFIQAATPSIPFTTLWILEVVTCAATLVLLWAPATSVWLRSRSVGPARPGL